MDMVLNETESKINTKGQNAMFPRIAKSKKKSGNYEYLVISESIHVKGKGSTTKNIANLGNINKFKAENILKLKTTVIRECGLSNNKVRYICTLAQAIKDDKLNFRKLSRKNNDDVRDELIQYPGIGQWSVDMFLMFSLQRADVFPVGDLVIRRSMQQHYPIAEDAKHDKYIAVADAWRPYRSIASFYLWKMSD